ncbi:hypothetical protein R8H71_003193 [Providencia rettgeri]|nr:hypothetical protein [Providencia rettgeri]
MDFIFDQTFWTAITGLAAFASLFITITPRLCSWISKKKPNVSIPTICTVGHFFGNPDFFLFVDIENDSQRDLKIESISISITSPSREVKTIKAYAYFGNTQQDQNFKAFVPLTIKKGTTWSNNIRFYTPEPGNNEKTLKIITKKFKEAISKAREVNNTNGLINCFDYDAELEPMASKLYENSKYWMEGQYLVTLDIETGNPKTNIQRKLNFNLLQIDVLTLEDLFMVDMKFGTGILMHPKNHYIYPILNIDK